MAKPNGMFNFDTLLESLGGTEKMRVMLKDMVHKLPSTVAEADAKFPGGYFEQRTVPAPYVVVKAAYRSDQMLLMRMLKAFCVDGNTKTTSSGSSSEKKKPPTGAEKRAAARAASATSNNNDDVEPAPSIDTAPTTAPLEATTTSPEAQPEAPATAPPEAATTPAEAPSDANNYEREYRAGVKHAIEQVKAGGVLDRDHRNWLDDAHHIAWEKRLAKRLIDSEPLTRIERDTVIALLRRCGNAPEDEKIYDSAQMVRVIEASQRGEFDLQAM